MALGVENYRVIYTANGSNDTFAIPQSFFSEDSNIKVYTRDESVSPATETLKTDGVHYSIVGTDVVFVAAPANALKVAIFRELDLEQILDMIESGAFSVESLELQLDRMVAISQQLAGMLQRAPKVQKSSPNAQLDLVFPAPEASMFLRWNAGGTALENDDGSGSGAVTKVFGEVPAGTIDNSNVAFTIANAPNAGTFRLYKNGRRVTDFTLVGTALTMSGAVGVFGELVCDYEF
jgi:hypothetical protein